MQAVTDLVLERHGNLLRQGAILVDPSDGGDEPSLLFLLTHEIKSGERVVSKRLQFVRVARNGEATFAGWAPHLDLAPLDPRDRSLLDGVLAEPWISTGHERRALALAAATLVPPHVKDVSERRLAQVDKTLSAVDTSTTPEPPPVAAPSRWLSNSIPWRTRSR